MSAYEFAESVSLAPYGVLGQQMKLDKSFVQHVPEPCSVLGCCFVDPAGLHHIQPPGGPANAHGAAGAIYKSIGIAKDTSFPEEVIAAITKASDAKYHKYVKTSEGGGKLDVHVIHTVGPDLRTDPDPIGAPGVKYMRQEAVAVLANAYANVLSEFVSTGQSTLRLLPVSGGIFAGEFMEEIGPLTWDALISGFNLLQPKDKAALKNREVQMCIFAEKELPLFESAGFAQKKRGAATLGTRLLVTAIVALTAAMAMYWIVNGKQSMDSTDAVALHSGTELSLDAQVTMDSTGESDLGGVGLEDEV